MTEFLSPEEIEALLNLGEPPSPRPAADVLHDVMRRLSPELAREFAGLLESAAPLAKSLTFFRLPFAALQKLHARTLQDLLRPLDGRTIAAACFGAAPELREIILRNVSMNKRDEIQNAGDNEWTAEEIEDARRHLLGPLEDRLHAYAEYMEPEEI